jgi:hypothetical protein
MQVDLRADPEETQADLEGDSTMPTINTFTGDMPFQAGFQRGKAAREIFEEEQAREDARFEAQQEMEREKLEAAAQENELTRLFREQQLANDELRIKQKDQEIEITKQDLERRKRDDELDFFAKVMDGDKDAKERLNEVISQAKLDKIAGKELTPQQRMALRIGTGSRGQDERDMDDLQQFFSQDPQKFARVGKGFGTIEEKVQRALEDPAIEPLIRRLRPELVDQVEGNIAIPNDLKDKMSPEEIKQFAALPASRKKAIVDKWNNSKTPGLK